jgi:RNA polymerase sporulation-specific sigma factor
MEISDEELAVTARRGDSGSLDALMHRFKNMVRSKASMSFLYGGDRDDLIQEGMIGLYKAVCGYVPGRGSFFSFASLCVNRQIMSAVKASARLKHLPLNTSDAGSDLDSLPAAQDNDPASLIVGRETYRDIGTALKEKLSPLEFDVLMRHIQGASRDEIAEATGRGRKSVDNTLQRARRKVEEIIF